MSVSGSARTDPHVESVALLAAWCESPAHLSQPPVEEALQEANFRELCALVARNWDCSEPLSPALRAELEAHAQQAAREAAERQPQLTAAEISQRSVDLLLREYYQMMRAKHQSAARQPADAPAGSGLGRLFLLICPAGPDCCSLRSLAAALLWTTHAAASSIVVLGCLLVPLWLTAIRHLLLVQQHTWLGAAMAVGGLVLLLGADALHRSAAARRHAAVAAAITPATLAARSRGAGGSSELRLLAEAGKRNNDNKARASSSSAAAPTIRPTPAAAAAGSSSSGGVSYLALVPDVCALQSALGLSGGDPPTSRERLQQDITRLCQVMGLPVRSLTSPAAMAAVLAELKSSVGI